MFDLIYLERSALFPLTFFDVILMVKKSTLFAHTFLTKFRWAKIRYCFYRHHIILLVEKSSYFCRRSFNWQRIEGNWRNVTRRKTNFLNSKCRNVYVIHMECFILRNKNVQEAYTRYFHVRTQSCKIFGTFALKSNFFKNILWISTFPLKHFLGWT